MTFFFCKGNIANIALKKHQRGGGEDKSGTFNVLKRLAKSPVKIDSLGLSQTCWADAVREQCTQDLTGRDAFEPAAVLPAALHDKWANSTWKQNELKI